MPSNCWRGVWPSGSGGPVHCLAMSSASRAQKECLLACPMTASGQEQTSPRCLLDVRLSLSCGHCSTSTLATAPQSDAESQPHHRAKNATAPLYKLASAHRVEWVLASDPCITNSLNSVALRTFSPYLGAEGRVFESCRPDQYLRVAYNIAKLPELLVKD